MICVCVKPGRTFHIIWASASVKRHFGTTYNLSISGFWGSKIGKCPVGNAFQTSKSFRHFPHIDVDQIQCLLHTSSLSCGIVLILSKSFYCLFIFPVCLFARSGSSSSSSSCRCSNLVTLFQTWSCSVKQTFPRSSRRTSPWRVGRMAASLAAMRERSKNEVVLHLADSRSVYFCIPWKGLSPGFFANLNSIQFPERTNFVASFFSFNRPF